MKKMSQTPVAFSDVAAIVKANLSGWYLLLALLLFSLFMAGSDNGKEAQQLSGGQPIKAGNAHTQRSSNYSEPVKHKATPPQGLTATIANSHNS
ncbi:hypothetical protein H7F15_10275 [Pontibacter sp. Tf4]|uniref:hypothetical protein n=1 Tax=Pontibacter sp. Tf4 TaxID=2761620 RepID=UPI0016241AFE|nr:hypothetical protein [Pontibacter sp. Tf4]MBB6611421.1 hypothetical protein [Pontibacter sp. Tf4]